MSSGVTQSPPLSIRIAANFTVEPIEEFLNYWMTALGIASQIRIAPYNQVFQQLLESGLLRSNRGGVNLVAVDLDARLPPGPMAESAPKLQRAIADFMSVLRSSGSSGAGGAVLIFPAAEHQDDDRSSAIAEAKSSILDQCPAIPGWSALDLSQSVTLYSVSETRDPFTDELGNIPFTE